MKRSCYDEISLMERATANELIEDAKRALFRDLKGL